ALKLAGTAGADRPWLMELVAGHLAAKRGDLAAARLHLQKAVTARPGDARVAGQAKASLALALLLDTSGGGTRHADELARAMNDIGADFGRREAVRTIVRSTLAQAYLAAGREVDAEFLYPGVVDSGAARPNGKLSRWTDLAFIKAMIA